MVGMPPNQHRFRSTTGTTPRFSGIGMPSPANPQIRARCWRSPLQTAQPKRPSLNIIRCSPLVSWPCSAQAGHSARTFPAERRTFFSFEMSSGIGSKNEHPPVPSLIPSFSLNIIPPHGTEHLLHQVRQLLPHEIGRDHLPFFFVTIITVQSRQLFAG